MSGKNNGQEENEEEKMSGYSTRRERSPSTVSQSSAALEWDPSADVGAMGDGVGILLPGTSQYSGSHLSSHQDGPLFDSTFDQDSGSRRSSRPTSRSSRKSRASPPFTNSTPSAAPVPLQSLDYSPVVMASSSASGEQVQEESQLVGNQDCGNPRRTPTTQDSSESNHNNDELTDDRRTPERVVSDASTDWEYDNEKKSSSRRYTPDWQTNGITRSEIEYQNRKKSGSSSSAASSVFLLQVEARTKNLCQASPEAESKKLGKSSGDSSNAKSTETSDMEPKKYNVAKRPPLGSSRQRQKDATTSESDPSSMCMVVNNFLKIVDEDPAKDRITYDVLKTHRDYHMKKVWKQIAKLEEINRALLSYKRAPRDKNEVAETSQESQKAYRRNRERSRGTAPKNREGSRVSRKNRESSRATSEKDHDGSSGKTSQKPRERSPAGSSKTNPEDSPKASRKNSVASNGHGSENDESVKESVESNVEKPIRKSPIGFFVPLLSNNNDADDGEEMVADNELNLKESKTIQEYLKERNPQCYNNIKERDDFLLTIKRERQVNNETLLRNAVEANMTAEEIDDYLQWNYRNGNPDEQRRLKTYWEWYMDTQKYKENKENVDTTKEPHVIPSKEMRERTQRLRMNDQITLARQKMEADERRKQAYRDLQKNFSTNLRQYQRLGGVNIPDRLKLGPRPR